MLENNNGNDFFANDGIDLGNEANGDFGGFTFDDRPLPNGIFDDVPAESENKAEVQAAESDQKSVEKPADDAEVQLNIKETIPKEDKMMEEINEGKTTSDTEQKQDTAVQNTEIADESTPSNLFETAVEKAEEKQAESAKILLVNKLPLFVHGSVKEEIVDTSKTFETLRSEKAEDFPELEEKDNVSWKVTYGTISKNVTDKKATIASFKKKIEDSEEFMKALKKAKKIDFECKISPVITAKKKGVMAAYKGLYSSLEDAISGGKAIAFVPSEDGNLFEVRNNQIGTFVAPVKRAGDFKRVCAGFIPALPKIPFQALSEIISFFKSFVGEHTESEALAYVYWSFKEENFYVFIPKQIVSKDSVDSTLPDLDENEFLLVMEIHSHNTMASFFSRTDDRDEKATRLYTVIGRIDEVFPQITTRISCGGKFVEINPSLVFESFNGTFPKEWRDAVEIVKPKDKENAV